MGPKPTTRKASTVTPPSPVQENEDPPSTTLTCEFFLSQIRSLREEITEEISKQKDSIIENLRGENDALKDELKTLKEKFDKKSDDLVLIEKDVVDLQQYIRRNNIEIVGIPNKISDKYLEQTVIDLADSIDVRISKNDIEACHRLKDRRNVDGPKRTIVRFVNRKKCDLLHRNKKKA